MNMNNVKKYIKNVQLRIDERQNINMAKSINTTCFDELNCV